MLKKLIVASAVLVASTSMAMADPAPYVGAGLGVTANTPSNSSAAGSFRGAPVNLFAGYGGVIGNSFYLAGELDGTVGTATLNGGGNMKTSYGFGASVLPGVMLSDHTLAFARAGVVRSRFTQVSKTQTGAKFGLGMQTSLTQNVDLRGEYDYTAYRGFNVNNTSVSPRADAATVSLVYKFE